MGGSSTKNKPPEVEDSSDDVDIEQENGSDELAIESEEEDYPLAPCQTLSQNGFITNRGAQVPTPRKPSLQSNITARSTRSLQTHRQKQKINYANAIASAMSNITHKAETYEKLLNDLTSNLETEREKIYAITLWLSQQDIETGDFKKYKPETPRGYMHLIQNMRGTFPSFFAQLCRNANIPCVIVQGYSKSASYDVGEMDDSILKQNTNAWNVVYADKEWHIVHPFWVCRGLIGHRLGGYVKIEKSGKSVMQKEIASAGQLTKCFNEYYIFTDPNEFVYRNIPVEAQSRWQLLLKPLTFEEYKHKPYVRPEFFKQKLKLKSTNDCVLTSENGICNIEFEISNEESSVVNFTYELDMKVEDLPNETEQPGLLDGDQNTDEHNLTPRENDSTENQNNTIANINTSQNEMSASRKQLQDMNNNIRANIARYVIMMRSGSRQENVSFEIRLPKEGIYKISIFAGKEDDWGNDLPLVASFRLRCDNLQPHLAPDMAPIDPGIVGWGPGPIALKSGLLLPSHEEGKIVASVHEEVLIQFQVVTAKKITVSMVHNSASPEELQQYYSYEESQSEHSDRRELNIRTSVPNKDEYAIRIGTQDTKSKQQHTDYICNYLLTTKDSKNEGNKIRRDGPLVKDLRKRVQQGITSNDLDEINYLLDRSDKFHLHAEQEIIVRRLQKRKEFLEMKKMFHDTYQRNNIDACQRAIVKAEGSPYSAVFKTDISKVRRMLVKLQSHDRWPHDIPEKNRYTLTEVSHLQSPPKQAQDVMKAICFLVFNFEDEYTDWTDTKAYLKNKQMILRRMKEIQEDETKMPSRNTMMKVKQLMESISEEMVRKIDNSLTPFYLWVKNVLERYDDIESRRSESKRTSVVPALTMPQ